MKFSQSLSSSKHIILSVVTYKLYLQQKKKKKKTTKKILNMKTKIQHVNSPSTSEENFLSQTSDQNTHIRGAVLFNTEKHKVKIILLHSPRNKEKLPDTPRALLVPFSGLSA